MKGCVGIMFSVLIVYLAISTQSLTDSSMFHKSNNLLCGPTRLSLGWIDKSKSSCAINCQIKYPNDCQGFMYNKFTRSCTPVGPNLRPNNAQPSVTEGDLYFRDGIFQFNTRSNGSTTAVYAYFTHPLNYTDATLTCACLNAHLYVADNLLKYGLMFLLIDFDQSVWIGLDDLDHEGVFIWVATGQPVDPFLKPFIFETFQPDNRNGNEDCVFEQPGLLRLNDAPCSLQMAYLCERS
ncbi:unnamed protein product [Lymnaea stagnalis]|uniref:C-type lectin domain-containing protein n=1 Tax=Lymnaea stagnalis TaxID=6523 RepID=A0AAV2HA09_LYMST